MVGIGFGLLHAIDLESGAGRELSVALLGGYNAVRRTPVQRTEIEGLGAALNGSLHT